MRDDKLPLAIAKARFADCIRRVEDGETLVLTRHGRPVARLVPISSALTGARSAGTGVAESSLRYDTTTPDVSIDSRKEALTRLLENAVWPRIPREQLGRVFTKAEREKILGLEETEA